MRRLDESYTEEVEKKKETVLVNFLKSYFSTPERCWEFNFDQHTGPSQASLVP